MRCSLFGTFSLRVGKQYSLRLIEHKRRFEKRYQALLGRPSRYDQVVLGVVLAAPEHHSGTVASLGAM